MAEVGGLAMLKPSSRKFRQPIVRFVCPFFHAGLKHPVAILRRLEESCDRQPGLAVLLFERECFNQHMPRHPFKLKGVGNSLGWHNFAIDAIERVFVAGGIALHEAPHASHPQIHLVDGGRVPAWSPPPGNQIRIGMRLEHEFARRVEDPLHDDLSIRR